MFQREVADRIVARPGSSAYGRLGVLTGWRADARILFDIPASAFVPSPKVTSSLVHLVPKPEPEDGRLGDLEAITQAAFSQRRKMLRQSLKSVFPDPVPVLTSIGIDPTLRAENLSIQEFVRLGRARRNLIEGS